MSNKEERREWAAELKHAVGILDGIAARMMREDDPRRQHVAKLLGAASEIVSVIQSLLL